MPLCQSWNCLIYHRNKSSAVPGELLVSDWPLCSVSVHQQGLKAVVDMMYNATGNQECHDLSETTPESAASDYQWCTQLIGGRVRPPLLSPTRGCLPSGYFYFPA